MVVRYNKLIVYFYRFMVLTMSKDELIKYISDKISEQFNYARNEHVNFLVDDLGKVGINELPVFSDINDMIEKTNSIHGTAEEIVYRHIKSPQIGRGEVWCTLTLPIAKKASKANKCDIIIGTNRIEFKEQVGGDLRFHNNNRTIELLTNLRKNLYILDRGFSKYHSSHELTNEWNTIGIMDRPNELSEGKLKKLESFFLKLRDKSTDFALDKWMMDTILLEQFSFDSFAYSMRKSVLENYDNIVIVCNGKYYLVNSTNSDLIVFKRISVGQPKFGLTIKKNDVSSTQNDTDTIDSGSPKLDE